MTITSRTTTAPARITAKTRQRAKRKSRDFAETRTLEDSKELSIPGRVDLTDWELHILPGLTLG